MGLLSHFDTIYLLSSFFSFVSFLELAFLAGVFFTTAFFRLLAKVEWPFPVFKIYTSTAS